MVNHNKIYCLGLRATLSAALLLAATSVSAVTVDGNVSDLITAIGSASYNYATGSDLLGSADSPATESNNGFDIKNVYSLYDVSTDTLYLGMKFWGTVGDSRAVTDTTSVYERDSSCGPTALKNCFRNVFDTNETYRFNIYKGTTTAAPQLLSYTVTGKDPTATSSWGPNGDTAAAVNPYSLGITRAVSIANNGIEFSITGLYAQLGAFSPSNPTAMLISFGAGSIDTNPVSSSIEDTSLLQMQVVPVPAAIWLFGSGLMGLVGVSARRRHNNSAAV